MLFIKSQVSRNSVAGSTKSHLKIFISLNTMFIKAYTLGGGILSLISIDVIKLGLVNSIQMTVSLKGGRNLHFLHYSLVSIRWTMRYAGYWAGLQYIQMKTRADFIYVKILLSDFTHYQLVILIS